MRWRSWVISWSEDLVWMIWEDDEGMKEDGGSGGLGMFWCLRKKYKSPDEREKEA